MILGDLLLILFYLIFLFNFLRFSALKSETDISTGKTSDFQVFLKNCSPWSSYEQSHNHINSLDWVHFQSRVLEAGVKSVQSDKK